MSAEKHLLILGSTEIARITADLARHLPWQSLVVAEADVRHYYWPDDITLRGQSWPDQPWALPSGCHVLIARRHDRDPLSVAAALQAGAEHVYLVASARRATDVIAAVSAATGIAPDDPIYARLSAPAGLDLGGQDSGAIALSVVAEMQWRLMGRQGCLRPLVESRAERARVSRTGQRDRSCPGRR